MRMETFKVRVVFPRIGRTDTGVRKRYQVAKVTNVTGNT